MICPACVAAADKHQPHTTCRGDSWCECQHRVTPAPTTPDEDHDTEGQRDAAQQ